MSSGQADAQDTRQLVGVPPEVVVQSGKTFVVAKPEDDEVGQSPGLNLETCCGCPAYEAVCWRQERDTDQTFCWCSDVYSRAKAYPRRELA